MTRTTRGGRAGGARSIGRTFACLALAALVACTPLYLPPQPGDALVAESRMRLHGTSGLAIGEGGALLLTLDVAEVPAAGWLSLQWFGPGVGVVASESIWLDRADAGGTRTLAPPPGLEARSGEWRAIASWYGRVVRQFRIDVD